MQDHHPLAVRLLLLALIIVSGWLFWLRFRNVWDRVRRARPETDFKLQPISRRAWKLFWEVLCQAKVIRERPLPGLAHAFVFWGFCAFALVTINHLATGFGAPLLSRDSGFGRAYFGFAALFAIAVSISITALAIRRFVERPRWLGEVSPESGVIAALIFLLMITY